MLTPLVELAELAAAESSELLELDVEVDVELVLDASPLELVPGAVVMPVLNAES